MDQYLTLDRAHQKEREMHLRKARDACHLFYEAVNAAKSGQEVDTKALRSLRPHKMPHYLEKAPSKSVEGYGEQIHTREENVYHSKSILGQIFDMAVQAEAAWLSGPDEIEMDTSFCFPNYEQHYRKWVHHYDVYRMEMAKTIQKQALPDWTFRPTEDDIFLKYKEILFLDGSSQKDWTQTLEESSAIYAVVYSKAKSDLCKNETPRLRFAWRVAGYPLCKIYYENQRRKGHPSESDSLMPYLEKQPQVPLLVSFEAYNEIFLRRSAISC